MSFSYPIWDVGMKEGYDESNLILLFSFLFKKFNVNVKKINGPKIYENKN